MEAVFLKILNMSLSAALVIVAVLPVRLALRRAPKRWRYLLWIVVAFRLVCPVSFSAPFSVLRLTAQQAVTQSAAGTSEISYVPQDIGMMAQPRVYVGTPRVSEAISAALPAAQPTDSANPLQIWSFIGSVLWCAGIAVLLLYGLISYVNLRRRLRGAVRAENGVFETDAVRAPFILGLFSPTIYLPPGLEGEPLRYVLSHERFHIRHADHAVKLLAFLLLCVHWFNPLVWLAFCLMSRDMEMRCDEAVLSGENGITKPYSMALLSFASARRFPSPSPLCFGETSVKERITNVLRWKKPKVWVTVLAALLCVIAVAACAANPDRKETTGGQTGTPWDWTSTVTTGAIKAAERNGLTLNAEQTAQLVRLLNAVQPDEVVRGRGIPSSDTLDIMTGVGYRLRWAGGIIELDFDDAVYATELYGSPETLGPGVWEIHNAALYTFLEGLKDLVPASATDLKAAPDPAPEGGDPAAQEKRVSGGVFDQKLRDVPEPVYVEVSASGAPRVELDEAEIRTLWDMYRNLEIVSEDKRLTEEYGEVLWSVLFYNEPGRYTRSLVWHIYPDNRIYAYRSSGTQIYAECRAGSVDYDALQAIYEKRRIIERSPDDLSAAFTAARAWFTERGITLEKLWYDPVVSSNWTIYRAASDRFFRGAQVDEQNYLELYCDGTWPESATQMTGATVCRMIRLFRERGDLPWQVIDHGNFWTPDAERGIVENAALLVYG